MVRKASFKFDVGEFGILGENNVINLHIPIRMKKEKLDYDKFIDLDINDDKIRFYTDDYINRKNKSDRVFDIVIIKDEPLVIDLISILIDKGVFPDSWDTEIDIKDKLLKIRQGAVLKQII